MDLSDMFLEKIRTAHTWVGQIKTICKFSFPNYFKNARIVAITEKCWMVLSMVMASKIGTTAAATRANGFTASDMARVATGIIRTALTSANLRRAQCMAATTYCWCRARSGAPTMSTENAFTGSKSRPPPTPMPLLRTCSMEQKTAKLNRSLSLICSAMSPNKLLLTNRNLS